MLLSGMVRMDMARRLNALIVLSLVLCSLAVVGWGAFADVRAELAQLKASHDQLLAERGIPRVDHVLSGLPLPSFPEDLRNSVIRTSAKTLETHGTFRQLTVMPLIYYKMYARYFDDVRFRFVPLNLPPGGVYVCRGFKGEAATT